MPSEGELKARLKQQAEAIIEVIIATKKPAGQNSLQDLEGLAIQAGRGFEQRVLEYLAQEESQAEVEPVCEACERRMHSRGKRKRRLVSEAGEIELERGYYRCPECGERVFPPR